MAAKISLKNIDLLGDIIRFHRDRAGLSRVELATIAGIGKTAIYDVEKGKKTVRLKTLLVILDTLNLRLELDGPLMAEFEDADDAKS